MRVRPRWFSILVAALAVAAALGSTALSARMAPAELFVTYEPDCTFTIANGAGSTITKLDPGDYVLVITTPTPTKTIEHADLGGAECIPPARFALTGPGVSLRATVAAGATQRHAVTLRPGASYTATDERQSSDTRAVFSTLSSAEPAVTNLSSGLIRPLELRGILTSAGKPTLTYSGKRVAKLHPGRYRVVLTDRSSKAGFLLRKAHGGVFRVTNARFVGKHSATVRLTAGKWLFFGGKGKTGSFLVTAS